MYTPSKGPLSQQNKVKKCGAVKNLAGKRADNNEKAIYGILKILLKKMGCKVNEMPKLQQSDVSSLMSTFLAQQIHMKGDLGVQYNSRTWKDSLEKLNQLIDDVQNNKNRYVNGEFITVFKKVIIKINNTVGLVNKIIDAKLDVRTKIVVHKDYVVTNKDTGCYDFLSFSDSLSRYNSSSLGKYEKMYVEILKVKHEAQLLEAQETLYPGYLPPFQQDMESHQKSSETFNLMTSDDLIEVQLRDRLAIETKKVHSDGPFNRQKRFKEKHIVQIFTHFFGDSFSTNSYLEGGYSSVMLQFLNKALTNNKGVLNKGSSKQACEEIIEASNRWRDAGECVSGDRFDNALRNLEPNESIIIPFGWNGSENQSGHATYLEITSEEEMSELDIVLDDSIDEETISEADYKVSDTSLDVSRKEERSVPNVSFSIKHFNLGGGVKYQDSIYVEDAQEFRYVPYTMYKHVTLDKLINPVFKKAYMELLENEYDSPQGYGEKELYAVLSLLGEMEKGEPIEDGDYQSLQRSGLCSWYSLNALLIHKLSYDDYARVYVNIGLNLIDSFDNYLKEKVELISAPNLEVFELGIDAFLQKTQGYYDVYTPEEHQDIEHVRDYQKFIAAKRQQLTNQTTKTLQTEKLSTKGVNLELNDEPLFTPLMNEKMTRKRVTFKLIGFPSLKELNEVLQFLNTVEPECKKLFEANKTDDELLCLLSLTSQSLLALPKPDNEMWKMVSSNKLLDRCQKIAEIGVRTVLMAVDKGLTRSLQIDAILAQFHLLAIQLKVFQTQQKTLNIPLLDKKGGALKAWIASIVVDGQLERLFETEKVKGDANIYSYKQYRHYQDLTAFFKQSYPDRDKVKVLTTMSELLTLKSDKNELLGKESHPHPFWNMVLAYNEGVGDDPCEILGWQPPDDDKMPREYRFLITQMVNVKLISNASLCKYLDSDNLSCFDLPYCNYYFKDDEGEYTLQIDDIEGDVNNRYEYDEKKDAMPTALIQEQNEIKHPWGGVENDILRRILSERQNPISNDRAIETTAFNNWLLKSLDDHNGSKLSRYDLVQLSHLSNCYQENSLGQQGVHLLRTLSTADKYASLILNHSDREEYQALFKTLLMSDVLNDEVLSTCNGLADEINTFFKDSFAFSMENKREDSACFCIKMMIFIQPRIQTHLSQAPFDVLNSIEHVKASVEGVKTITELNQLKMAYFGQFPDEFERCMTVKTCADYISAARNSTRNNMESDKDIVYLVQLSRDHLTPQIYKFLIQPDKNRVNEFFKTLFPKSDHSWKAGEDGTFSTATRIKFNLRADAPCGVNHADDLPREVQTNSLFQNMFNEIPVSDFTIRQIKNGYQLKWNDDEYQLKLDEDGEFDLLLIENGEIYRLIENHLDFYIDTNLASRAIIENYHIFLLDGDNLDDIQVKFIHKKTGRRDLKGALTKSDKGVFNLSLQRIEDGKVYLNTDSYLSDTLERVERVDQIELLGDEGIHVCNEINLKSLGIVLLESRDHFDTNSPLFICQSPPELRGAMLEAHHYARGLDGFEGVLRFRHNDKSMLLLPNRKIVPKDDEIAEIVSDMDQKSDGRQFGAQYKYSDDELVSDLPPYRLINSEWVDASSCKSSSVDVSDSDQENILMLAYVWSSIQSFEKAYRVLNNRLSSPLEPKKGELNLINAILTSVNTEDPRGAAVYLTLLSNLLSRVPHKQVSESVWKRFDLAFRSYTSLKHVTYACQISEDDEKKCLRFYVDLYREDLSSEVMNRAHECGVIDLSRPNKHGYFDTRRILSKRKEPTYKTTLRSINTFEIKMALSDVLCSDTFDVDSCLHQTSDEDIHQRTLGRYLKGLNDQFLFCYYCLKKGINTAEINDYVSLMKGIDVYNALTNVLSRLVKDSTYGPSYEKLTEQLHYAKKDRWHSIDVKDFDRVGRHLSEVVDNLGTSEFKPLETVSPSNQDYPIPPSDYTHKKVAKDGISGNYRVPFSKRIVRNMIAWVANKALPSTQTQLVKPNLWKSNSIGHRSLRDGLKESMAAFLEKRALKEAVLSKALNFPEGDILVLKQQCGVAMVALTRLQREYSVKAYDLANAQRGDRPILKPEVSINVLTKAFAKSNRGFSCYQKLNVTLGEDDCEKLHEAMFEFIQSSRKYQQVSRVLNLLNQFEERGAHRDDVVSLLSELNVSIDDENELTYVPPYNFNAHPAWMVLEHKRGIALRPLQIEKLSIMSPLDSDQQIHQMIMGLGKTDVISPILAFEKADGKRLVVQVLPDALVSDAVSKWHVYASEIFGQRLELFEFNRQTELNEFDLDTKLQGLDRLISDEGVLVTTAKSMHCLYLKYVETLLLYLESKEVNENLSPENKDDSLSQRVTTLGNIAAKLQQLLNLFSDVGEAIIDEADTILNSKRDTNFTIGQLVKPKKEELTLLTHLHRSVFTIKNKYAKEDKQLTKQNFQAVIKDEIINLIQNDSACLGENLQSIFEDEEKRVLCIRYLNHETEDGSPSSSMSESFPIECLIDDKEDVELEQLAGSSSLLSDFNDDEESLLILLRYELDELLETTCLKENFVNYGPDINKREKIAIPYIANNTPSQFSRFDQIHEILNYTIQMVQEMGVEDWVVREHLEQLFLTHHSNPQEAEEEFKLFFPGVPLNALNNDALISERIECIQKLFSENPVYLDQYLEKYILGFVSTNNETLSANSFVLLSMFHHIQGFTGTPWNKDTFPVWLETVIDNEADGESLDILLRESTTVNVQKKVYDNVSDILGHLNLFELNLKHDAALESVKQTSALVDAGALLKGTANRQIAELLYEKVRKSYPHIKGVVFYEGDIKSVLVKNTKGVFELKVFEACDLKPYQRFTYYDHRHCVGSDIKQPEQAEAIVTLGQNLMLRDLFQAIWRLRGLSSGQTLSLFVPLEVHHSVHSYSRVSLLGFLGKNQADQLDAHLIQSAKNEFSHVYLRNRFDELRRKTVEEIPLEDVKPFINRKNIDPKSMYSVVTREIKKEEAVTSIRREVESLFESDPVNNSRCFDAIEKKTLKSLSKTVRFPLQTEGKETEMQIEALKENLKETDIELEVNTSFHVGGFSDIPTYGDITDFINAEGCNGAYSFELANSFEGVHENIRISRNQCSERLLSDINSTSIGKMRFKHKYQLNCDYILAIKGPNSTKTTIMLHEWEVGKLMASYKSFLNDSGKEHNWAGVQFGIFTVSTKRKVHLSSSSDKSAEWFLSDRDFQLQRVQVKFLNGELEYSEDEFSLLTNWVHTKPNLLQFFMDDILGSRPHDPVKVTSTKLYKLLKSHSDL